MRHNRSAALSHECRASQTKNPPRNDFLKVFARTNTDFFDVFQKKSNILLTAKQTQSMYKDPNSIYVAPAKLCGLFFQL